MTFEEFLKKLGYKNLHEFENQLGYRLRLKNHSPTVNTIIDVYKTLKPVVKSKFLTSSEYISLKRYTENIEPYVEFWYKI